MSDDPLRSLLRPSESLKCLLNVQLAPENTDPPQNQIDSPLRRRWIALLTHHDQRDLGRYASMLYI